MIYYLYGPDSYRRREKLKEIIDAYRAKHRYADLFIFDADEDPDAWPKAIDFANQPSMFSASKVLVIRESGAVKEKQWITFLKAHIKSDALFIFVSDAEKPLKAFSFLLESPHKMEFPELSNTALALFVKQEAEKKGVSFTSDAFAYFIQLLGRGGSVSWRAVSELERFSLLGYGLMKLNDLKKYSYLSIKKVMYEETRNILRAKTIGERLKIFEYLILQQEAPSYIFNSIAFHSSGRIADVLAKYDISVKRGALEYEEAMLSFLLL